MCRAISHIGITLLLSVFLLSHSLQAQQLRASYPVQVNAMLLPPYTFYLSDFCNSSGEKIILTLLNRDLMQGDINVRLHVSIHAGNIRMETKDYNVLPVFTLQSGVPAKISQSDLCPYFQTANLNITGAFSGKFPEGMVEICFSVFEANSGQPVSQTSCARAWLRLNRPPMLSFPQDKANYPFREPQQIVFQWTPRHQALSNVEYEFTLKEIYNSNTGVENAFAYSPTLYSTTVYGTSLPYNTAINPPFLEGRTYAWQVRAIVREGFEEQSAFENNGYSEIRSFYVMPSCKPPFDISARQEGNRERIEWTPSDPEKQHTVAYRGKENGGAWHTLKTAQSYADISNAAVGREIEYKVGTVCADGTIVYSEVQTFVLEDQRAKLTAQCGNGSPTVITDRTPIEALNFGDVFTTAGVPVTVTEVSGSKGVFSGYGWMQISILAEAKIACKFTDIQINSAMQHFSGTVESVYDKQERQVKNLDNIKEVIEETIKAIQYQLDIAKEKYEKGEISRENYEKIENLGKEYENAKQEYLTNQEKLSEIDEKMKDNPSEALKKQALEEEKKKTEIEEGLRDIGDKLDKAMKEAGIGISGSIVSIADGSYFDKIVHFEKNANTTLKVPNSIEVPHLDIETGKISNNGTELPLFEEKFLNYQIYFTSSGNMSQVESVKERFDKGNVSGEECLVWLHFDVPSQSMGIKLKYGDRYFGEQVPPEIEARFRKDFLNHLVENMQNEQGRISISEQFFQSLLESRDLFSQCLSVFNYWIQKLKLPEQTWREGERCIIRVEPFHAGLIDGLFNEVKGMSDFIVMAYDFIFMPSSKEEFEDNTHSLDIKSIVAGFWEEKKGQYGSGKLDEITHQTGSDLVFVVSTALGLKALYTSAKVLVTVAVKNVGKLTAALSRQIGKYTSEGYEIIEEGGKYFAKRGSTVIELGEAVAKGGNSLVNQIDNAIAKLTGKAKYVLEGTGEYGKVAGHHPLCKSAFRDNFPTEALFKQYYDEAFSVSVSQLEKFGGKGVHAKITGHQNSLYKKWRIDNPTAKLTIDDMAKIEIQAMKNAGIPEDVATGWVVKALEKCKTQGVNITNIPWNGMD